MATRMVLTAVLLLAVLSPSTASARAQDDLQRIGSTSVSIWDWLAAMRSPAPR